jgi:YHS domain-containing protein
LALGGRCAVCLVDGKQWATGSPQHSVMFDGREYRFPGDAEKSTFLANPDRYAPALNGNSVVEYVHSGNLVPGDTRFGLFYKGRVYLLQNEQEQRQFQANQQAYADADLAYRGESVVSLLDANRRSPGNPKFATRYGGFRFLFTSAQQLDKFLANPARYVRSNEAGR